MKQRNINDWVQMVPFGRVDKTRIEFDAPQLAGGSLEAGTAEPASKKFDLSKYVEGPPTPPPAKKPRMTEEERKYFKNESGKKIEPFSPKGNDEHETRSVPEAKAKAKAATSPEVAHP